MKKSRSRKKLFLVLLFVLMAIGVFSPVYLLYQLSGDYPLVATETKSVDPETAESTRALAKRLLVSMFSQKETERFSASEKELNHLLTLASRGSGRMKGRINISSLGVYVALSLYIPENPFGDYINTSFIILPSMGGLELLDVRLGKISLEGDTAIKIAEIVLNYVLGNGLGSKFLASLEKIGVNNNTLEVVFHPIPGLKKKLEAFWGRVRYVRKELNFGGDPVHVRYYFRKLCQFDQSLNHQEKRSLAGYIPVLFQMVRERTGNSADPENEYRAAILAMSIYFGSDRFETIVGRVKTPDLKNCEAGHRVLLAGRNDLMLHFIISAGLKVLSDNGIPFVVGEFKELLDTRSQGSGFSFVDLAADRAGLRFAEFVLSRPEEARLGALLERKLQEEVFFPDISGLPEGISKADFDYYYQDLDSIFYQSMLEDIDKRIGVLPLYH